MVRSRTLAVLALCCARAAAEGFADDEGGYGAAPDDDERRRVPWLEARMPWREWTGRLQRAVDAESLVRARRLGNSANGALLAATGPISLAVSVAGMRLSNMLLSLYVTAFGGVLAGVELGLEPIAPWVADNMSYLSTDRGRVALLAFLGGLTWPLGRLGLVPGLLTCLNALFNANFARILAFVAADDAAPPREAASPVFGGGLTDDEEPYAEPGMRVPPMDAAAEPEAAYEAAAAGPGGRGYDDEEPPMV